MYARLLSLLLLASACTRTDAPVVTPPAPAVPPPAPARDLAIVGGDLVDLATVTPVFPLTTDLVLAHGVAGDTAYLWARRGPVSELRAFDTTTGAPRWTKPESNCWAMVASTAGVFCAGGRGARWFRKADGDVKAVGSPTATSTAIALGGRVLVVHADKKLEAFDASGALMGTVLLPVHPDNGYDRSSLIVGGSLACGTRRSDAATTVLCVDATPMVAWSRTIPVSGGLLRQVDTGALVVASDTWRTAVSSEVLRPSDGSTLLHMGVRLSAALTTAGALDGVLSSDPAVTLYDAKGIAKWTWTGAAYASEALRAVRSGPNIVVALYNPIATGTQLFALDASTGALAWRGNVDQLPLAHSKYSNDVQLRAAGSSFLLLGHESSQDYAQLFDATGARTASVLRGR